MSHKGKKNKKGQSNLQRTPNAVNQYDLKSSLKRISQRRSRTLPIEYSDPFSQKTNQQHQNAVVGQNIDSQNMSQFYSELQSFRMEFGKNSSDLKLEVNQNVNSTLQTFTDRFEKKIDACLTNKTFAIIASFVGAVILFIATYLFMNTNPDINKLNSSINVVDNKINQIEINIQKNQEELKKLDSISTEDVFEIRFKKCKKMGGCK